MFPWRGKSKTVTASVLDVGYLERLQKHLGVEVTRELMADGMIELSDRLDRIPGLAREGSGDALARLTHEIAGAAGHLGLAAMSVSAIEANRALRGDEVHAAKDLERVMSDLQDLRHESMASLADFCQIGEGRLAPQLDRDVPD